MHKLATLTLALLLSACASYSGRGLVVGDSSHEDVIRVMGPPALEWTDAAGSRQLAYPRGPMGVHTYMLHIGPDGKLLRIGNVLEPATFASIKAGMSGDEVLRILGPSIPSWTAYFERRDELVWGWRFCNDWNHLSRFFVLFDGTTKTVRSTLILLEERPSDHFMGSFSGLSCSR